MFWNRLSHSTQVKKHRVAAEFRMLWVPASCSNLIISIRLWEEKKADCWQLTNARSNELFKVMDRERCAAMRWLSKYCSMFSPRMATAKALFTGIAFVWPAVGTRALARCSGSLESPFQLSLAKLWWNIFFQSQHCSQGKLSAAYDLITQGDTSNITHAKLLFVCFGCSQASVFDVSCSYCECEKALGRQRKVFAVA